MDLFLPSQSGTIPVRSPFPSQILNPKHWTRQREIIRETQGKSGAGNGLWRQQQAAGGDRQMTDGNQVLSHRLGSAHPDRAAEQLTPPSLPPACLRQALLPDPAQLRRAGGHRLRRLGVPWGAEPCWLVSVCLSCPQQAKKLTRGSGESDQLISGIFSQAFCGISLESRQPTFTWPLMLRASLAATCAGFPSLKPHRSAKWDHYSIIRTQRRSLKTNFAGN